MLTFHAIGDWPPPRVRTRWVASSRRSDPVIDAAIEQAWEEVHRRPGVRLFDGPMCRLENWQTAGDSLELTLSPTSYKPFLGTNLMHPELAGRFGRQAMANPVGVSPALLSADGFLMMGRRNQSVAYYPGRLHPFAGALEPRDVGEGGSVFDGVRRELAEELSLAAEDLTLLHCTGIAEDQALLQPELIFRVACRLQRDEIAARMDRREHGECWSVAADPKAVAREAKGATLTPVARAALLLYGRVGFGAEWFEAQLQTGDQRP